MCLNSRSSLEISTKLWRSWFLRYWTSSDNVLVQPESDIWGFGISEKRAEFF
jgi:hypothetical protein